MITYYFDCGCVLTEDEVLKLNNRLYCPEHPKGKLLHRERCCRNPECDNIIVSLKKGKVAEYCKECSIIKNKRDRKRTSRPVKLASEIQPERNTDCAYYADCLLDRLYKDNGACLNCPHYKKEPLTADKYLRNYNYGEETLYKIESPMNGGAVY